MHAAVDRAVDGSLHGIFIPEGAVAYRAIAYLKMGGLGCHDLGVLDKVVFLTYHTT